MFDNKRTTQIQWRTTMFYGWTLGGGLGFFFVKGIGANEDHESWLCFADKIYLEEWKKRSAFEFNYIWVMRIVYSLVEMNWIEWHKHQLNKKLSIECNPLAQFGDKRTTINQFYKSDFAQMQTYPPQNRVFIVKSKWAIHPPPQPLNHYYYYSFFYLFSTTKKTTFMFILFDWYLIILFWVELPLIIKPNTYYTS